MKIRVQRPVQHPIVLQIALSSICSHTRNRSLITREKSSSVSHSARPYPYNGKEREKEELSQALSGEETVQPT